MGILNVTPDSFSDGGKFDSLGKAYAQAVRLKADGADIIDVGGESTRPGSDSVHVDVELERTIPVIEKISHNLDVLISIDTNKSKVAEAALKAGAHIVNDISGLTFDPDIAAVTARHDAALAVMHMKGSPKTMQEDPRYDNVVKEVKDFLVQAAQKALKAGVKKIIVDPGFGFGKRLQDNYILLKELESFKELGWPLLIGTSRKAFTGKLFGAPPDDRLEGTIATNILAALKGADILRVHDVKAVRRAVDLAMTIENAE
ncbi:dihydropteroate synthase [bacterium]|nr:dihydropteroate synthase [bacterium]